MLRFSPLLFSVVVCGQLAMPIAQAQPALFPLSPSSASLILPMLETETASGMPTGTDGFFPARLATAFIMVGEIDRAAELSRRMHPGLLSRLGDDAMGAAFEFQGALLPAFSNTFPSVRATRESAERQLATTREGTPERDRVVRMMEAARADYRAHEAAIAASSLFAAGKVREAIEHSASLPERGRIDRERVQANFMRTLALRGEWRVAFDLADGLDPATADKHRWLIAQHLAFRKEFAHAATVVERIGDDGLWRGAKLGIALAQARFGMTDKARIEINHAIANRGRPLPPGALANPPTPFHTDPLRSQLFSVDRTSSFNMYVPGAGQSAALAPVSLSLVALNLSDEGDMEGARAVLRALAQSIAAKLDDDRNVTLLVSVARRQIELGDGDGAMLTLDDLDRVAWLVAGSSVDGSSAVRKIVRMEARGSYAEATAAARGMEAAFARFPAAGDALNYHTYCAILVGAVIAGGGYDDVIAAAKRAVGLDSRTCDDKLLLALAGRQRFEEIAELLSRPRPAISVFTMGQLSRYLAMEPPSPAVVRVRELLFQRCVIQLKCGHPDSPSRNMEGWTDLLLIHLLHGESAERLDTIVGRFLDMGYNLSAWTQTTFFRPVAAWLTPRQVDEFLQVVGRAMTEPAKLHMRAEVRAHAGDLPGALELVRRITHPDIRVEALVAVAAATWRREHRDSLEFMEPFSVKRRAKLQ
ncbi:MAG TPA: hypothetical protein VJ890_29330 [Vineibacter sp.]|nr:hypothetical protein [Vineibacter sp.]